MSEAKCERERILYFKVTDENNTVRTMTDKMVCEAVIREIPLGRSFEQTDNETQAIWFFRIS